MDRDRSSGGGAATVAQWVGLIVCVFLLLMLVVAGPARALSPDEARHFANRTGYADIPGAVERFLPLSREEAVDTVLRELRTTSANPAPSWAGTPPPDLTGLSEEERRAAQQLAQQQRGELVSWWYLEMLATPSPLTERLVYFWHNHFTSSLQKVNSAGMMYRQNALFRREGTRDFGALLAAIVRDPAMLVYLDNTRNRAAAPNENLARELMELFTIGIGNYSEADVKEVARALTGYTVDPATELFRFDTRNHDAGVKTILGRRGNFTGDDVARILRDHPKTAELIVAKLWRFFVSPDPNPAEVARLAQRFSADGHRIRPLLRDLFLTRAFWDPANRASLIKAPHEFVVQTARQLGLPLRESLNLAGQARSMGQDLMNPPTVKGWPGHLAWIDTMTLPARQRFAGTAVRIFRTEVAPTLFNTTANALPRIDAAGQAALQARFLTAGAAYVQPPPPVLLTTALQAVLLDAAYITK